MRTLIAAAVVAVAIPVTGGGALYSLHQPKTYEAGAFVKIMDKGGHGSATHIGDGYLITAAHVVRDATEMTIKTDNGKEYPVEVLWSNTKYDVALVRLNSEAGIASVNMECREPIPGEAVQLVGNPMNLEFIRTWGHVSGEGFTAPGYWERVIPIDAAIGPGMSGGALLDADGDMIGINVGGFLMTLGMAPAPLGIGGSVPASAICDLMGR